MNQSQQGVEITGWTLKAIREESSKIALMHGWMEAEMDRYQWVTLTSRVISHIINGGALLVCTDDDRRWFGRYVICSVNRLGGQSRPILPIFDFTNLLPRVSMLKDVAVLNDMLGISYQNHAFWYIGKTNTAFANLAFSKENGFLWILDESIQNGLMFSSLDSMLDYKLIQLFRVFEQTLFGVLFGEITLE